MHTSETVRKFYDGYVEMEWDRFNRHPVEFAMTKRILARFIAKPGSRILDVGGGPGRYSLWLAGQGHRLSLFDLSAGNLEFARRKSVELGICLDAFIHGNVLELGKLVEGPFDQVLLMGPLYHLLEEADRRKAVEECLGVLAPGGCLFASFISAYAPLLDALKRDPGRILPEPTRYRRFLDEGVSLDNEGFVEAYFINPRCVEAFMAPFGFERLGFFTTECLIGPHEKALKELSEEEFERCVDIGMTFAEDESCRGSGEHFLYVGRLKTT